MHLALKTRGLLPQPTRPPSPIAASTEASPLRLQPFPVLPIRPSLSGKGQEEKGQSFAWNREANLGEARPNKHSPGKFPFQKSQEGFRSCASDSHLYLKVGRTLTQVNESTYSGKFIRRRRSWKRGSERRSHVQPLLYCPALNTSNMGTGPTLVTTWGMSPFHFPTAALWTSICLNRSSHKAMDFGGGIRS